MYDIFFIADAPTARFDLLKIRFPLAKFASSYADATQKAFTKFFWVVRDNVVIADSFKFDYCIPQWDEKFTHVFKNASHYDGVCLLSKKQTVSKNEFDYNFFVNKKEVDITASAPRDYDRFEIDTYEEYLSASETTTTDMFWAVSNNLLIESNFKFDYQIPRGDPKVTHVFKNGSYFDGVCLFSKKTIVSRKEFDYKFFVEKKEMDIVASTPKPYDIVFISYFEKSADINFQKLLDRVDKSTTVYRIKNVDGIHNAHRAAAALVKSNMFWVVDADAILDMYFNFEFPQVAWHDSYTQSIVHVWSSQNPVNDLVYGYGGVKLLPTKLTLNMDSANPDMTTSISTFFKSMPQVSNISAFNSDPFSTWRSAFRECVKLSSRTIKGQVDDETSNRLEVWCTIGADRLYGEYAISGALAGRNYGRKNADDVSALFLINDYEWLRVQFEQSDPPLEK
jgi:hypothetical protein